MSTLRPPPKIFKSLAQLNLLPIYGDLMLRLHEAFNGPGCPFTESTLWTECDRKSISYSMEQIHASMRRHEPVPIRMQDGKNTYKLAAPVVSVTVVTPAELILICQGTLERFHGGEEKLEAPVTVVCYYSTDDGRGFALLSDRVRNQLWCNN